MSGFEWFFAILSIALMMASLWIRALEDRGMTLVKIRRPQSNRRLQG